MGANQSSTSLPNEKLLVERLRELQLRDQAADDYVHVDEKTVSSSSTKTTFKAPWKTLSVSEVQSWEHELLQDAKNRLVPGLL